jgi:hypothetical protein
VFEASLGSGLGAKIDLVGMVHGCEFSGGREYRNGGRVPETRRDAAAFGEFIGSALIEVGPDCDSNKFPSGPHYTEVGEITTQPKLVLTDDGRVLWQGDLSSLVDIWSKTFWEVLE